MDEFVFGAFIGALIATVLFAGLASYHTNQHDVGMMQNICMYIDDRGSQECISSAKLLEVLREKR